MDWLVRRPWVALALALVVASLVYVVNQGDVVASDPLWYAVNAHDLATRPSWLFGLHDNHPFVMRLGLTGPLALLYLVFGVSPIVTNLPALSGVLGTLLVIYAAAPTPRAKLLGMLLGITCVPLVEYATILNVDLPCGALMACSVLYLTRRDRPRGRAWVVAALGVWFAAFLVKETALWAAPVWIYAVVVDVRAAGWRQAARTFAPAIAVGVVLAAGYLWFCAYLWGDPFARFAGIQQLTYEHNWSMVGKPAGVWLRRLTTQPARMVWRMFHVALVPVVIAPWLVRGRDRIWVVAAASVLGLFWFGSSSFAAYAPLPALPRMVLPALPFLLVAGALAADQALDRLPDRSWRIGATAGLAAALIIPAVRALATTIGRGRPETAAFARLRDELTDPDRRVVLVCTNPRCLATSPYYFAFEPPPNLSIVFARDFALAPRPAGVTVRALVNLNHSAGARMFAPQSDLAPPVEALALPTLVGDRTVRLYDAGDGARLWDALRAGH